MIEFPFVRKREKYENRKNRSVDAICMYDTTCPRPFRVHSLGLQQTHRAVQVREAQRNRKGIETRIRAVFCCYREPSLQGVEMRLGMDGAKGGNLTWDNKVNDFRFWKMELCIEDNKQYGSVFVALYCCLLSLCT